MLESVYIRNFKAIGRGVYKFFGQDVVLVGENNSGKTSFLEALDCFFNRSHIDSTYFVDLESSVRIGVQVDGHKYMREFDPVTLEGQMLETDGDWSALSQICLVYLSSQHAVFCNVAAQLAHADAVGELAASGVPATLSNSLEKAELQSELRQMDSRRLFINMRSSIGTCRCGERGNGATASGAGSDGDAASSNGSGSENDDANAPACTGNPHNDESPAASCSCDELAALLTAGFHTNAILAIDDIEQLLGIDGSNAGDAGSLSELQRCFAQTIVSTNSPQFVADDGSVITYPITEGAKPGAKVAKIVGSMAKPNKMLLLVEGQYDLPWYKRAVDLLGLSNSVYVIPGGGSNSIVLLKELRRIGIRCILIRDGDMSSLANPSNGDYALELDCIEMYAPDKLLLDCFGVIPKRSKDVFFKTIIRNAPNFPKSTRGDKKRFSRDDVKGIIASKVGSYLDSDSRLVREVASILESGNTRTA